MSNRERYLLNFPHMAELVATQPWAAKLADEWDGTPKPQQPVCSHRGVLLDVTTCHCKVYHCKLYGTCSDNKRAGLRVCRGCPDFKAPDVPTS